VRELVGVAKGLKRTFKGNTESTNKDRGGLTGQVLKAANWLRKHQQKENTEGTDLKGARQRTGWARECSKRIHDR